MKPYKYTFTFCGGNIVVYAMNYEQAEILAKAEAIKKAWNYTIVKYSVTSRY